MPTHEAPAPSARPPRPSRPSSGGSGEPPRRTQAERRARAEAALLAAAARLVAEHGSAGVTLARVGEEAGFSRGLATHYFGSRAALLTRLQEEALSEAMAAAAPERSGSDPVEELCRFARACLDGVRRPTDLGRAFVVLGAEALAGSSELTDAVARLDARMRGWVAGVVRQGAADGQVRAGVDPDAYAVALVGLLKGLIVQAAAAPESFAVDLAGTEAERWIRLALTAP
ncbi:TetR/AcrR family transcriptional regulator [Kitasatospora sp. NPDC058201]|uniref:TetR/AcrR family transcriptional regulator n=1 Tax=unclassified Kitasatospora TaxID=2633591 RepID=UPI003647E3F7